MATYKGIQGYTVQSLSEDPTASESVGKLWYNSSTGKFKVAEVGAAAWASSTSTPTAMFAGTGAGTSTAALTFGGWFPPGSPETQRDLTFEFDGSSWTSGGVYPAGVARAFGYGTQTAALGAGGYTSSPSATFYDTSNTYNGSSWTAGPTMNTGRSTGASFGITTAAVAAGGSIGPRQSLVEEFNGTSWSEVTALPTVGHGMGGAGIESAGLSFLGSDTPGAGGRVKTSYAYDGSSWTATNDCNTARTGVSSCGNTQSDAMVYGGSPGPAPYSVLTEQFNGTSWTEVADLSTQRQAIFNPLGQGGQTSTLAIMGDTGVGNIIVEEWSGAPVTAKTVTVS